MADKGNDDAVPRVTEQMREVIAEEVGKAIENSLSGFIDKIQNTVLSVADERIKKLEDSANLAKKSPEDESLVHTKSSWRANCQSIMGRTHCDEEDYVAYGTGQLKGQAKDWWDNKKKEIGSEAAKAMTWDEFKTPFLKHHSPKAVINRIKEEFMQLRHKGESIDKITGMFMDKMKFCDELVTNEEQKIYYYYNMVSAEYREFMIPSKYETLTEIINVAREWEIELKKQVEWGERRAHDVNPSPTKKARTNETGKKSDAKGGSPSCKIFGKGHKGECRFKDKPCPICWKTGHMASSCPEKVTVCYNCYRPGHKKSECPDLVGKKDGQDTKGFSTDNEEYTIDMIPMSMGEFQVIVGMDWLFRYHAKVACFRKEIKLTSPSGKHVTIYGEKGGNLVVCTMLEAHRLMKHGCKAYIVYAIESERESLKVGDVPVVRDYEDVFPEDLPGIPPKREVEFIIE
ncbi:uncharacterized protein LOC110919472 [Helianthus annuus]|uniref:uncharacterized protein LOC110919472 n=1 Tax=Helianthus annuus TaxID=4232 RepID=UPI000B901983|nr:uncharacterized protein LOC110919472 [Helianthus annuus]